MTKRPLIAYVSSTAFSFLSELMACSTSSSQPSDKGKGRAKSGSLAHEHPNLDNHNLGSGSTPGSDTHSTTLQGPDQSSEVARLKEQLAEQRKASRNPCL
jgi:hypothetical protein